MDTKSAYRQAGTNGDKKRKDNLGLSFL